MYLQKYWKISQERYSWMPMRKHLYHLALQQTPAISLPAELQISSSLQKHLDHQVAPPAYITDYQWYRIKQLVMCLVIMMKC
jgi:hypothetical protein